jgi:hypothetical protein
MQVFDIFNKLSRYSKVLDLVNRMNIKLLYDIKPILDRAKYLFSEAEKLQNSMNKLELDVFHNFDKLLINSINHIEKHNKKHKRKIKFFRIFSLFLVMVCIFIYIIMFPLILRFENIFIVLLYLFFIFILIKIIKGILSIYKNKITELEGKIKIDVRTKNHTSSGKNICSNKWASFNRDENYVFIGYNDNTISVWDINRGILIMSSEPLKKNISFLSCSLDGLYLIVVYDDNSLSLFNIEVINDLLNSDYLENITYNFEYDQKGYLKLYFNNNIVESLSPNMNKDKFHISRPEKNNGRFVNGNRQMFNDYYYVSVIAHNRLGYKIEKISAGYINSPSVPRSGGIDYGYDLILEEKRYKDFKNDFNTDWHYEDINVVISPSGKKILKFRTFWPIELISLQRTNSGNEYKKVYRNIAEFHNFHNEWLFITYNNFYNCLLGDNKYMEFNNQNNLHKTVSYNRRRDIDVMKNSEIVEILLDE